MRRWKTMPAKIEPRIGLKHGPMDSNGLGEPRNGRDEHGKHVTAKLHEHDQNGPKKPMGNGHSEPIDSKGNTNNATEKAIVKKQKNVIEPPKPDKKLAENPMKKENPKQIKNGYQTVQNKGRFQHRRGRVAASRGNMASETVEDHPLKEFIGKGVKKDKIGQKDSIKPHDKQQELTKKVAKEDHDIQHKLDNKDDTEKKSHPTNPHFELHAKAQKALEVSDDHLKQTEMHSLSLHKMGSTGRTNSTKNLKQINSSIPKIQGAKSENFVKLSDHHRNDAMKQLEHHKIEKNQDKLKQELTKETKETRENSIPTDKAPQKDHQNKHLIGKIGNDVKTNSHEVGKKELTNNHKSGRLNLFDAHSNKLGGKKDDLRRSKTAPIGFRRLNYVQDSMLKPEKILHKEDEHVNSHPAIPKIVHASPVSVLDFPESDEYSSSSKEHGMNEAKEEKIQKHAHESEESRAHEKVLKKIHTNKSVKAKEGIKNARKPSHPAIPKTQTASPESLFDFPGSDELDYSSAESEIHDEEHEKEIMDHGFPPESLTSTNAEKSPKLHHEQSENLHIKESSHISSVNSNKGPLEIVSEKENKETIKVENEENKVIHKNGPLIDKENPEESKKEKNSSFLDEKLAKSVENKAEDKVEVKKSTSEVEIDNKMVAKTRIEKKQESLEKVSEKIKQNDKSLEEIPMKRKESVLDKVKSIFFGKPESEPIKEVQMVTLDKIVEKDKEGRQNLSKENENEKHKLPPLEESKAKFEGPPKSLMEIFMSMGEKTKRIPKSGPIRKFKELRNRTVWYGYEFDENVAAKTMKKLLPAIPLLFDVFNINSTVQKAFGSIKEKAKQEIKGEEVDLRVNTPDKKPTLIRRIKFDNPLGNLIPFKASFNEFLKIESGRRELNFETLKEFFSKFENFGDKLEKLVKNRKDKHENSFKILSKLKKDKLQELVLNRKVDSDLEKMINQKALSDQKFEEMVKILHENGEAGLSLELEKGIKEKELIEEQLEETIKEFDKSGWDEMVKKNEVDLSVLENIIRYWTDPNKYEGFYIIPIDTYLQMSENAGVKVDGQELDKITDYSIVDQYYFLLAQFENSGRRLKKILGLKLHQIAIEEKLKNLQEQFNFDHKEKDILEKLLKFSLDTVNIVNWRARDSQDQPAEIYYSLNLDLFIKMWGDKWAYELFQNENLNIGHLLMHTIKAETDGEEYHQMVSAYPTLIKKFDEHFKFFKNFGESEKQVNNIIQSAKGDLDHFMPILEKKVEKMNENLMKIANAPLLKWLGLNSIFSAADKSQAFGKLRDAIKLLLNASTDLKVDKKNKKVTALEKLITDAQKKEKEFTNFKNALKPVHIAAFFEENENAEDGQLDANVVDSPTMLEGQSNAERKEVGMVSQRALNAAIPSPPSPPPPPSKSKLPPRPPPPPPKAGNNASPRSAAPPPIPPGAKIGPPPPPPAPPKIGNSKAPPAPPPPPPSFKSNSNGVKGIPPLPQSSKPIGSPPPVPPPPPPMLHPKKSEKSTNLVKVAENTTNAIKSSINVNNAIKATKIHIDTGQPVTLHHQSVMPAKTILEAHPKTKMEEFMKRKILQMREFQKSSSESASSFEKT